MIWDTDFALSILPRILGAAWITLAATLAGFAVAMTVGLLLACRPRGGPIAWLVIGFVEGVRSTPLLVQVYFLYYVLPNWGITMTAWQTGVLALGLHYGCYLSEVYRAGFESVAQGQREAAIALNFGRFDRFRDIVLPQALRPIAPALGNYLIGMFKETPILFVISVHEMLSVAKLIGSETFRYTEPYTIVGAIFLALSLGAAALVQQLERRLGRWAR
ncbi:MAG: ectoine/hydroxyectoine ABC transporter permease subunit EhuD [Dongiaceae bacterium]